MKQGLGELVELYLENGQTGGKLRCPNHLIPAPGQYLLTHDPTSHSPLPVPVFKAGSMPGGFCLAPPLPPTWIPGTTLSIRGPFGRGFSMPVSARRVALVALTETPARLKPVLHDALAQNASVVLVSDLDLHDLLPPVVEIQPLSVLAEVAPWADYLALDVARESLPEMWERLGGREQARALDDAQVLILTPVPCGGIAKCGLCTVYVRHGWKMACKDGPVFDLQELK